MTALLLDFSLLMFLSSFVHYLIAATLGFFAGAVVQYFFCVRYVFGFRKYQSRKLHESTVFILIGVGGVIVNAAIISLSVESLSLHLAVGKLFAAGGSFIFNYLARKKLLF